MTHRDNLRVAIGIAADTFLRAFESEGFPAVASAITYLAVLAVDGDDRKYDRITYADAGLKSRFREEAHNNALIKESGIAHDETKAALRVYLESHDGCSGELQAVEKILRTLAVPAVATWSQPVRQATVTQDDHERKVKAMRERDIDAVRMLVGKGVEFNQYDMLAAVTCRENELRPELVRLMCLGGAPCPAWVRNSITDPALLEIIDGYSNQKPPSHRR